MRRRWFQFRLRSLLLGMTFLAGLLALWRWLAEPYREQRATMAAIAEAGGTYESEPGGPGWLRPIAGNEWFQDVVAVDVSQRETSPALMDRVLRLPALRSLAVSGPAFTDDRLERLRSRGALRELIVSRPEITRQGADAFEQARPDVTLRIALSFAEMTPAGGEKCHRQASWGDNVEWGAAPLPERARRWAGKTVRLTGVSSYGYEEAKNAPGLVVGMDLRASHPVGWIDVVAPPWEVASIRFRHGVRRAALGTERLIVDGILGLVEGNVLLPRTNYVLGDAVLVSPD